MFVPGGFFDRGHIRYSGNGGLWHRPYGGSLWKSRNAGPGESNQSALPLTFGASPRLGLTRGQKIKSQSKSEASYRPA
ncbi:hypothetical protein OKW11_004553 [Pseudomonas baetica]|nr:hypothetical protein [Pseudomonas baetica]